MKKYVIMALLALCLVMAACTHYGDTTVTQDPQPSQTTVSTAPTTQSTAPTVKTGWEQTEDGIRYFLNDGSMATGWQKVDGNCYYFAADGILQTGWLQLAEGRFYLGMDGVRVSGWQEVDGCIRYFRGDGCLANGWETIEDKRYYFDTEGLPCTGWLEVEAQRYYLGEDGVMHTGWLESGDACYYLKEDGTMAKGCVEIDGVKNYFTSAGRYILLVNPWNYVPEGYTPDLVQIDSRYSWIDEGERNTVDRSCSEALLQMLKDCKAQGHKAVVVSAYRSHAYQIQNHERKVRYYLNLGYDEAEARRLAAMVVAIPGTSEHELGLAVDLVDSSYWQLDEAQADTPAQQWLMEHSWEYGFILRYPTGKTDVTGIIYEPWHYRYVGVEVATELHELGLTLEEYLQMLTET